MLLKVNRYLTLPPSINHVTELPKARTTSIGFFLEYVSKGSTVSNCS